MASRSGLLLMDTTADWEDSMNHTEIVDLITEKMMRFNQRDPKRIQHFIKVHRFAQLIGRMEHVDAHMQFIIECAALVHDIGIRPAEEKYGSCTGKMQEQEGPAYARRLLEEVGLDAADIDRICYLVAHHHTYTDIDGMDYQILVEADFLVNFYEDALGAEAIQTAVKNIFHTAAGKSLCRLSYGKD